LVSYVIYSKRIWLDDIAFYLQQCKPVQFYLKSYSAIEDTTQVTDRQVPCCLAHYTQYIAAPGPLTRMEDTHRCGVWGTQSAPGYGPCAQSGYEDVQTQIFFPKKLIHWSPTVLPCQVNQCFSTKYNDNIHFKIQQG